MLIGSAISGLGAGLLWPAQGQYFQRSAVLYAKKTNMSQEAASGFLAGIFTGVYMGAGGETIVFGNSRGHRDGCARARELSPPHNGLGRGGEHPSVVLSSLGSTIFADHCNCAIYNLI